MLVHHRCERVAHERQTRRQGLVDHNAEREEIRAGVHGFPERLFRGHVCDRPDDHPQLGLGHGRLVARRGETGVGHLGQPKAENFDATSGSHDEVGALDIAVDDTQRVRLVQRIRDLIGELQDDRHSQRTAADLVRQRFSLHQLHHDEEVRSLLTDVEGCRDRG